MPATTTPKLSIELANRLSSPQTDPKNMDYTCERGAKRNFEPWRAAKLAEETDQERLDRLEREEAEHDAMAELEAKTLDAKTEMAIADALDEIRTRNARLEGTTKGAVVDVGIPDRDEEREREEREDDEATRRAFGMRAMRLVEDIADDLPDSHGEQVGWSIGAVTQIERPVEVSLFKRTVKKKKDFSAALGLKKKQPLV